ncbi:MAG: SDR family NAD(P)-dependent oxidoreductase [Acidiferrobacterales bacterium]|nr:SDR family NAD(P)-dependent oxidoreductase [Acidiferrobacterales bacterium]
MNKLILNILGCILFLLSMSFQSVAQTDLKPLEESASQKAVLVTGASTGIGRNITETLAKNGYLVYAGARKASDLEELNSIENVQSVRLDVTIQSEIDAAVTLIENSGIGLYGLVNNAGVVIVGPLTEVDEEELKWMFDVNVYGPYRLTQAFAPLIIQAKGRIINISSISGILAGKYLGQYSMSKHAVEAYTDSLASELEAFDVKVSAVEPGNYNSQIGESAAQKLVDAPYMQPDQPFAEDLTNFMEYLGNRTRFKEPDDVASAVLHGLFDENPKRRYMVVPEQSEADITLRQAMRELIQLNTGQPYTYSREELIEMLDEIMAEI